MKKVPLPLKLTLIFSAMVIIGLIVGYAYISTHLNTFLENFLQERLRQELVLSKQFIEKNIGVKDLAAEADSIAKTIGQSLGLRATIIRTDGTVIGDTDVVQEKLSALENHLERPEIQDAINKGFGISKRYSYTIKKYLLYAAMPYGTGTKGGFLRFSMPLSHIAQLEAHLRRIAIFALISALIVSIALNFFISWLVSRPIKTLVSFTNRIKQGDFSQGIPLKSHDEIGELGQTLFSMAGEIEKNIEQIKHESATMQAVISSMFEGIMVTDAKGMVVLMNPSLQKLFFIETDPRGKKPLELIRNRELQDMVDMVISSRQKLISKELHIIQPDEKTLAINGAPVLRDDSIEGAVFVFHDITELRRLEKVRQEFVANVSHELRTPATSIKGYSETLIDGALNDTKHAEEFLHIIHQDSVRLTKLIDDLLDLSKIESGKMDMTFIPLELKPIVEKSIKILDQLIREKSITISIDIPNNIPKILADEMKLSQVFLNLLDNAVKYNKGKGTVTVHASLKDTVVQIDIQDTGIGIPANDINRIFERFYRVDKARSRELGGTGLGLSIVKHIVRAHGGDVWVKSEHGRGSTFSFAIPRA